MHQDNLAYSSYAVVWVFNCSDAYNNVTIRVEVGLEVIANVFAPLAAVLNMHLFSALR